MSEQTWPPMFTLDQERILNLLTGDRFYSNPSAALREAVLNAIDAIHRRRKITPELVPAIGVTFDRDRLTMAVADNGVGMSRADITGLFTKVGASAADLEANKDSIGEFGIGVVSYFMAGDSFALQTNDGTTGAVGLGFSKGMLAGAKAVEVPAELEAQGTTVVISVRDAATFDLLLESFPQWCRDVEGLSGAVLPDGRTLRQGGLLQSGNVEVEHPEWVERAHLGPVAEPTAWDAMTGVSKVAVLYRGVFVQELEVKSLWGISGSIDVDPKYFKPRLNREGFVEGKFQAEVEAFLRTCHPTILAAMAGRLDRAVKTGALDKWTEKRWATLWLSVPRSEAYADAVRIWDAIFRTLPAFELWMGNKWEAVSLQKLTGLCGEVFVAPLADESPNDVVKAAVGLLRNTGRIVMRGVRRDRAWMQFAPTTYGTTADLISAVFASELPPLIPVAPRAEIILAEIGSVAQLFTGPPPVDLVRLGVDTPPALKLKGRLVINIDNPSGKAIAADALRENAGPLSLIAITARHAYDQLAQVASVVRAIPGDAEALSPIRRRFIRSHL